MFSTRSRGDVPKELPVETLSHDKSGIYNQKYFSKQEILPFNTNSLKYIEK